VIRRRTVQVGEAEVLRRRGALAGPSLLRLLQALGTRRRLSQGSVSPPSLVSVSPHNLPSVPHQNLPSLAPQNLPSVSPPRGGLEEGMGGGCKEEE
jgi:hypothetical protein